MLWLSFRGTAKGLSHTYTCIRSPWTSVPSRLAHNIEQSSTCCTVGPCWLSVLNMAVCSWPSKVPNYPFPLETVSLFSKSVSFFLFGKFICIISFYIPHGRDVIWYFSSVWLTLFSRILSRPLHVIANGIISSFLFIYFLFIYFN